MSEPTILRLLSSHDDVLDAILDHLARYRMSDAATLQRLPTFDGQQIRLLRQALKDGRGRRLIDSAPLYHGVRYWHLCAEGAVRAGLPAERSGPLSESAKLRAFAMHCFCWESQTRRHLLNRNELARYFSLGVGQGLPDGYYFDSAGAGRLGLLRIDAVRKGRWDRALHGLRRDINRHALIDGFRQLAGAGRFLITLITALPQKAKRLREALRPFPDARRIPVEIVPMPQLVPLLSPVHRKEVVRLTG